MAGKLESFDRGLHWTLSLMLLVQAVVVAVVRALVVVKSAAEPSLLGKTAINWRAIHLKQLLPSLLWAPSRTGAFVERLILRLPALETNKYISVDTATDQLFDFLARARGGRSCIIWAARQFGIQQYRHGAM